MTKTIKNIYHKKDKNINLKNMKYLEKKIKIIKYEKYDRQKLTMKK